MRSRGFTLIELLVVVSIITMLVAIVFPTFVAARERARQSNCASNLKQIALASLMYAHACDERFPQNYFFTPAHEQMYWWMDVIQPFMSNWQIFICPSGIPNEFETDRPRGLPNPLLSTYGANALLPTGLPMADGYRPGGVMSRYPGPASLSEIRRPAECIMVAEAYHSDLSRRGTVDAFSQPDGYILKHHNGMANWAFVDGHVKAMGASEPHMWNIAGN